jgi:hypothetical protein
LKGKLSVETITAKCEALVSSCCLTKFLSKSEGTLNDGNFTRNAGGMKATGGLWGGVSHFEVPIGTLTHCDGFLSLQIDEIYAIDGTTILVG